MITQIWRLLSASNIFRGFCVFWSFVYSMFEYLEKAKMHLPVFRPQFDCDRAVSVLYQLFAHRKRHISGTEMQFLPRLTQILPKLMKKSAAWQCIEIFVHSKEAKVDANNRKTICID